MFRTERKGKVLPEMFLADMWLLRGRTYELMGSVSKVSKSSVLRLRESWASFVPPSTCNFAVGHI